MSITLKRVVFSLICAAGVYGFAGLAETQGGLWDKITLTSRKQAASPAAPDRLRAFFTDEQPIEPETFQLSGNEVSIEAPPALPEEGTPAPAPSAAPPQAASAPEELPAAAAEKTDFCTTGCAGGNHSWWCRQQKFWACQSELSRERRLKNSRNMFKKSYYETFPAYHVENYGIYRTCWRKLPEIDCCPEDVGENELVPAPTHSR